MVSTPPGRDKASVVIVWRLVALGLVLWTTGCGADPSTARGTAERFLDAHYVAIDLRTAQTLTSGLAREKLEREIALVGDQQIDDTTRKPIVHYKFLSEQPGDDGAVNLAYRGQINVPDAEGFERRWLVTVRRQRDAWLVTNFQELAE